MAGRDLQLRLREELQSQIFSEVLDNTVRALLWDAGREAMDPNAARAAARQRLSRAAVAADAAGPPVQPLGSPQKAGPRGDQYPHAQQPNAIHSGGPRSTIPATGLPAEHRQAQQLQDPGTD